MSADDATMLWKFLRAPLNRRHFDNFFQLCFREVRKSLLYLRARGYRLPTDQTDPTRELENLTVDILGSFLRSEKNHPFCVIFEFFENRGIAEFRHEEREVHYDHFLGLLRNFTKQELHRIRKEQDPQVEKLKRRVNEILRDGPYEVGELVVRNGERETSPAEYDDLLALTEQAFLGSRDTTAWCASIFEQWREQREMPLCVRKSDLVRAMVRIYFRYIEIEGFGIEPFANPHEEPVRAEIRRIGQETLQWLRNGLLARFLEKQRLQESESEPLVGAVETYLIDRFEGNGADALPDYFREALPGISAKEYLSSYKYVFETLIKSAIEEMRRRIEESPTIRRLRHY